ncbi:LysR substrate-binding domain-containing protein [Hansschlegelia beijingensis]|uniref:DNA-binding transcriptional LysR family regulator n=1 Tax=Hansschlegelia beijingensis TaxID=1133344 RepID=A0A7W6D3Y2_9HYPH|nr:LysR substrate-binding domain-containing protein [Hansschlegelia beijingensis]MBB3973662.1 DNA-binding transcriptional LysR family regulator [Hansschlegelia beijingensis]
MARTLEIVLLRTFVMLVEERSVTRVARRLHRTQPAVSLQLRRLEEAAGQPLFEADLRRLRLTPQGEALLPYARALLRMHDEARLKLASDEIEGRVTLGCPDLYAAFLLPETLASFRRAYPRVEVSVRCALSRQLAAEMDEGLLDVAIATRMPGVDPRIAETTRLRSEPLVWLGAEGGGAYRRDPIPLAMLPEGNLYRDLALAALNEHSLRWRVACVSESIAGLQAMALADAAVIVLAASVNARGLVGLEPDSGLPALPTVDLMLWRRRTSSSEAAEHFARHIERHVGN